MSGDNQSADKCDTASEWSTVGRLIDEVTGHGSSLVAVPAPPTLARARVHVPMRARVTPGPPPTTPVEAALATLAAVAPPTE